MGSRKKGDRRNVKFLKEKKLFYGKFSKKLFDLKKIIKNTTFTSILLL